MTPKQRANLSRLLTPRHIAFIGGRDCEVALREAERIGFTGAIWPVNPRRERLGGHPCYASVADLPDAPDATFLAVPAPAAVAVTAELAARGAGGIVCYTAGFREAGGGGAELEDALIRAAGDMALIGPNCYGMINYMDRAALWPFAHGDSRPAFGAAIITQSGMLSSDITHSQRSLPITHMISCGNQSVLSLEDYAEHLIDHPAVRAVGLHIEGLRDIAHFARVALRALEAGKPIVALKTGSSRIGAALTVSHTGSLAGDDALHDALFARLGIVRVHSPAALLETLKFLVLGGAPQSNRLVAFTCSGGGATMVADHGERIGLEFPAFRPEAKAELETLLPPVATVSNPLDYTTPIWGDASRTGPVFAAALDHGAAAAAVLVQDYPAPGLDESRGSYLADARAFLAAARARAVPAAIVATLSENMDRATRDEIVALGGVPMQGLTEALDAIGAALAWGAARRRILASPPAPLAPAGDGGGTLRMLDEADGKALLAGWGLAVPTGSRATGDCVERTAARLGFPVVLKMMGPKLAHKSDAGAVAVGLASDAALRAALTRMREAVRRHDPQALTDDFLVEAMAPKPVAELVVGLRRDPRFGMAMTVGAGGVLVELLRDSATLLLPASRAEIERAVMGLKVATLLAGHRGTPPADMAALLDTLATLAERAAHDPAVAEIEINPLFAGPQGCIIVDALVHLHDRPPRDGATRD